jgi:hypothetical protein
MFGFVSLLQLSSNYRSFLSNYLILLDLEHRLIESELPLQCVNHILFLSPAVPLSRIELILHDATAPLDALEDCCTAYEFTRIPEIKRKRKTHLQLAPWAPPCPCRPGGSRTFISMFLLTDRDRKKNTKSGDTMLSACVTGERAL